jgi:hypothetical protein
VTDRVHACLECGEDCWTKGDFCSPDCRVDFNNRRKARGSEIYDLYMAFRYERKLSVALGVWQAIARLAAKFRDEDRRERGGRRSWRRPGDVLDERPYLTGVKMRVSAGR